MAEWISIGAVVLVIMFALGVAWILFGDDDDDYPV